MAEHGFQGHSRLGNKVAVVVGSQGAGAILGYVALLAIGRFYAPGAYGAYLFAVSLIGLAGTFFQLGFTRAHQREVGGGVPADRALGVYVRIRLALLGAMIVTIAGALASWFGLGKGFTDSTSLEVVIIILASSVLAQLRHIGTDTWTAQGRVHRAEWTNFVDSMAWAASIAVIGLGLAHAEGRWHPLPGLGEWIATSLSLPAAPGIMDLAIYIALGHFLGKVVALSMAAYWWVRDSTHIGSWDSALAREYRDFAFPVALTSMLLLVLQHTDVLMIGFFWTTREVGLYGAAQKLANIALLANIAVRGLLMPYFTSLMRKGEGERALRAFRQIERFLLLGVVPVAIAMMIWAEEGIHIFVGDGFLGAGPALQWLAAWTLIAAMNMPVRAKHMAAGHTQILLRAAGINVAVNIVLNLLLIPGTLFGMPTAGLGPEGAAIATFASSLVAYLYNRMHARHMFGVQWIDLAQVRMLAAGLAPAAIWMWMHAGLPATAYDRVWELLTIGIIGGAVYLVIVLFLRGLRKEDLGLLQAAMHPGRVFDELRGR